MDKVLPLSSQKTAAFLKGRQRVSVLAVTCCQAARKRLRNPRDPGTDGHRYRR